MDDNSEEFILLLIVRVSYVFLFSFQLGSLLDTSMHWIMILTILQLFFFLFWFQQEWGEAVYNA